MPSPPRPPPQTLHHQRLSSTCECIDGRLHPFHPYLSPFSPQPHPLTLHLLPPPRPYTINGYKFDMRIYVVATCFDPLRIYVYHVSAANALLRYRYLSFLSYC